MRAILALFVLLPLAGCLDDDPVAEVGAERLVEDARAIAVEWNQDAALFGIMGIESRQPEAGAGPTQALLARSDPHPGDGKAPAWLYTFRAPNEDLAYAVVMDAAGKATYAQALPDDGMAPLGTRALFNWTLSAEDAWATLADEPAWQAARDEPDVLTFSALTRADAAPIWLVGFELGMDETVFLVDADTGERLQGNALIGVVEQGSMDGTVSVTQPAMGFPVDLIAPHAKAAFAIEVTGGVPGQSLALHVTAPDGREASAALTGSGVAALAFDDAPAGTYEASVTLEQGVQRSFTLSHCTTGIRTNDDAVAACDHTS